MKTLHVASIVVLLTVVCLSIGLVSALTSSDGSVTASLSSVTPKAGDSVLVYVTFQSNVAQELKIYGIGVQADWMQPNQVFGPNLQSAPATVEANSAYSAQFSLPIPSSASLGTHSYTVIVDGLDASGNAFEFNSTLMQLQVLSPSASSNPNGTTSPDGGSATDWLPYIVVAAAAVVVVVLVLIVLMKGRKTRKPAAPQPASEAPQSPAPQEPGPDQEPEGQDFDI